MTFVQIVECRTERPDELNRLMDTWIEQTQGRRTATHAMVGADRADAQHIVEIVEFPSYEAAMRNSGLPETDRIFREMVALCQEPPTFTNLDLVRDEQLQKAAARRLLVDPASGDMSALDELLAPDYRDHDPSMDGDTVGPAAVRQMIEGYRTAFDFTFDIQAQIAEGDQVATRWVWRGTHIGEFMGMPASNKTIEAAGMTVFRFEDGMVKEGWWSWDGVGMMRQMGMMPG
ncbi:ester cyclase [Streptomyces sp. CB01881]|uniref:ester cyclase n=1 Tax=Streptomyces sp. CB01881 TaxID=2078691 RepID=UPI000CDCC830|nr:ester cyclase [Streptomyces sp. CB01881]AUY47660.1 ester cyclase [Streptomyces sp. CB01881]TYC76133.1 ester cyclase [Streptomyces sp. CB01881]